MRYEEERHMSFKVDDKGDRELMANFVAEIAEEIHILDGLSDTVRLRITGRQPKLTESGEAADTAVHLPTIEIDATEFPGLAWVLPLWGVRAIIRPGQGVKEDLRTYIQLRSRPKRTTIYRHLGWARLDDGQAGYLHAGGAITRTGNRPSVRVELGHELARYDLTAAGPLKDGVATLLDLVRLTQPEIGWPLMAAALTPLLGPTDFAVHVSGRTGTFKSELMSLYQALYGPGFDARHLPGSWSSTGNALEAQAFLAKDTAFTVDDFVPSGTSWQVRAYQQNADRLVRAQGNQGGRSRLTDTSRLQQTMYPRGVILSTGEDIPDGHSVRARMMILELSPGDIDPGKLSKVQARRGTICGVVAGMAKQLAGQPHDLGPRMEQLRPGLLGIGHTRTPTMLSRMVATVEFLAAWWRTEKLLSPQAEAKLVKEATKAITDSGRRQPLYLEEADPVDQFAAAIRQAVASGGGHFRTLNDGVPKSPVLLGWTEENASGEMPTYKSRGPHIGWVDWSKDELFLEINVGFAAVKRNSGGDLALSKQTLFKRLKDSGRLVRVDEARSRNTIRITAGGHPRQVISLSLSQTLELKEVPQ
jgi:hypothetical protein